MKFYFTHSTKPRAALCLPGPIALSVQCKLASAGAVVAGTMSITRSEVYFEMDDDDVHNRKLDPQVSQFTFSRAAAVSREFHREFVSFEGTDKSITRTENT